MENGIVISIAKKEKRIKKDTNKQKRNLPS